MLTIYDYELWAQTRIAVAFRHAILCTSGRVLLKEVLGERTRGVQPTKRSYLQNTGNAMFLN